MAIYFFWGDDDFVISQQITSLKEQHLDRNWLQFNLHKLAGDKEESIRNALMEAMTPPFGNGDRIVILQNTNIGQQCSAELLSELKRVLPQIPSTTHLLFTSQKKPNGKLKSSKLINQYSQVKEFSLIPPWQTEVLSHKVAEIAAEKEVNLTPDAQQILADAVGNNSLLLWQEVEKLATYQGENKTALSGETILALVNINNRNSLQLAQAIVQNNLNQALQIVQDLINANEPALRIVATLVGQFRTWAIVKTAIEAGEKDEKKIAVMADIRNPKRLFFLKKEIRQKSSRQLNSSLPILLELESKLKLGYDPLSILQTKIIELCNV